MRGTTYCVAVRCGMLLPAIGSMLAVQALGMYRDPRLEDYLQTLRKVRLEKESLAAAGMGRSTVSSGGRGQAKNDANGVNDGMPEETYGKSPVEDFLTDEYQEHYQQTDKKALLEAIRRADGKGTPDGDSWWDPESKDVVSSSSAPSVQTMAGKKSEANGSAWDRLREKAEEQNSQAAQELSRVAEDPQSDDISDSRS